MAADVPAILVKSAADPGGERFAVGGRSAQAKSEVIFTTTEPGPGLSAAAQTFTWRRVELDGVDGENAWDVCHALASQKFGAAGGKVAFAEPDLTQQWIYPRTTPPFAAAGACKPKKPQSGRYPIGAGGDLWFRNTDHAGFDAVAAGAAPRIAHLDTGYDPNHDTLPRGLNRTLQKNFVGGDAGDAAGVGAGVSARSPQPARNSTSRAGTMRRNLPPIMVPGQPVGKGR